MQAAKDHIISQLRRDILLLEGFRPENAESNGAGLDIIKQAFPNSTFPSGVLHEFLCTNHEDSAASYGFIAGIISYLMKGGVPSVWISQSKEIFPPALTSFRIESDKIIFIQAKKPKERLWVVEEALKCDGLSAVVAAVDEISFAESRRLQLATEQSRVTGFLVRRNPKNLTTCSVTKWRIRPLPGEKDFVLPGIFFPRWNVDLIKVRNGKPGSWQMEWRKGQFHLIRKPPFIFSGVQRKIV